MKNTVTFETAIAMKDAGFQQPEPAPRQFWYDFNSRLFIVYNEGGVGNCFLSLENGDSFPYVEKGGYVFAPTATDILEKTAFVSGDFVEVEARVLPNGFCVDVFEGLLFGKMKPVQIFDTNPHEAAAKAFLELKKAGK